jgi:hypothetical protein
MRDHAVEDIAEKPDEKHSVKSAYRVLYDGQCEICRACVSWLKALDHENKTVCLPINTPEQKYEVVLRNLRGETQESLQKELGIAVSEIQRWKQVFLEVGLNRLRTPTKSRPVLTEFRTLLQKISDETDGWDAQCLRQETRSLL